MIGDVLQSIQPKLDRFRQQGVGDLESYLQRTVEFILTVEMPDRSVLLESAVDGIM